MTGTRGAGRGGTGVRKGGPGGVPHLIRRLCRERQQGGSDHTAPRVKSLSEKRETSRPSSERTERSAPSRRETAVPRVRPECPSPFLVVCQCSALPVIHIGLSPGVRKDKGTPGHVLVSVRRCRGPTSGCRLARCASLSVSAWCLVFFVLGVFWDRVDLRMVAFHFRRPCAMPPPAL